LLYSLSDSLHKTYIFHPSTSLR